jgi:hypothetical protein
MRLPDPSTLERGFPLVGNSPAASPPLSSNFIPPPCPTQPINTTTQPDHPASPTFLTIPPYDPTLPETLSQYARRFNDVLYGDTPTRITEETTRFVLNNPNGVTRNGLYDHLTEYLMELLEIGVDVIQLPEANVDWRHPNEYKKCRKAVTSVFNRTPFSPATRQARLTHHFYNLHMQHFKTG